MEKKRTELTKEGKKYLERGLPEKNLVNALKAGPMDFGLAKKKIDNFNIALQWAKKNGWIEVKACLGEATRIHR